MPRKYTVTSTVKVTYTTYKRYNTFTDEVEETMETNIPTYTSNTVQEQLKELRKVDFEACKPISQFDETFLYGMDDDTFMSIAQPIKADERRNLITRTVKSRKVNVKVFDMNNPEKGMYDIDTFTDITVTEEKLLNRVRKQIETDTFKVIAINNSTVVESLFGCTKALFMVKGTQLDPVTRKELQ